MKDFYEEQKTVKISIRWARPLPFRPVVVVLSGNHPLGSQVSLSFFKLFFADLKFAHFY